MTANDPERSVAETSPNDCSGSRNGHLILVSVSSVVGCKPSLRHIILLGRFRIGLVQEILAEPFPGPVAQGVVLVFAEEFSGLCIVGWEWPRGSIG